MQHIPTLLSPLPLLQGVCIVPASHKANLECPPGLAEWDDWQHLVTELHGKAGDAIIFSETCTHGTV